MTALGGCRHWKGGLMCWNPAGWCIGILQISWILRSSTEQDLWEEKEERKRRRKTERGGGRRELVGWENKNFYFFQSITNYKIIIFFKKEKPNNLNRMTLRRVLAMEMDREFWGGCWEDDNLMACDEEGDGLSAWRSHGNLKSSWRGGAHMRGQYSSGHVSSNGMPPSSWS